MSRTDASVNARRYALAGSTRGFAASDTTIELVAKLGELGHEDAGLEPEREHVHPQVRMVIGRGGRHVLAQTRQYPGAVTRDPAARNTWIQFAKDGITMAADMGAECVMVHSGHAPKGVSQPEAWRMLVDSMAELAGYATQVAQRVAAEWPPEILHSNATEYLRLHAEASALVLLGSTIDVGHVHSTEGDGPDHVIRRLAGHTINVRLEEMRALLHKHVRLGEGEPDVEAVFVAFNETGFAGIVALESNASHGDDLAESSLAYLRRLRARRGAA
jgi:sugar phosphate isomerase/epimerase